MSQVTMNKIEKQIAKAVMSGEVINGLGTVVPNAKIKFIDDHGDVPQWVTIAVCVDSPNHVREAVAKARQTHKGKTLWVHHVYGKEIA